MSTSISDILKIYSKEDVSAYINTRAGETKFGEKISFIEQLDDLKNHKAKYVLLGIPEDIGVRANYGNAGTSQAWKAALGALLNIQHNYLTNAENLILLGEINCDQQMAQADDISLSENHAVEELGALVEQLDHKVSSVIKAIVASHKIPIIIGGGHNNSYGNLRGTSEGLNSKVNCINFDAHTDFRALEHRHSGNGFSYAYEDGYLNNYFIFGLHRNYTSQSVYNEIEKHSEKVKFNLFKDIAIKNKLSFTEAIQEAETHSCNDNFGIELDMDSIELMGSSAMTPSGFSLTQSRQFLTHFSKHKYVRYIHICEGSPKAGTFPNQIGKAIAYLVSDVVSL